MVTEGIEESLIFLFAATNGSIFSGILIERACCHGRYGIFLWEGTAESLRETLKYSRFYTMGFCLSEFSVFIYDG